MSANGRRLATVAAVLQGLLLTACTDSSRMSSPTRDRHAADRVLPGRANAHTYDIHADFLDIESRVPGFAGIFIDSTGNPTVLLTDRAQEQAAAAEARLFFARRGDARDLPIRFQSATFPYSSLHGWLRQIQEAGPTPGLVSIGIDHRLNRIQLGAAGPTAKALIADLVRTLGVPLGAVVMRQESEPKPVVASIADRIDPIVSSFEIAVGPDYLVSPGYARCTAGYNVYSTRLSGLQMLVASHCTRYYLQQDPSGTTAFQDMDSTVRRCQGSICGPRPVDDGTDFGWEGLDPDAYQAGSICQWDICGDCPSGFLCRWSDATLLTYSSRRSGVFGEMGVTGVRGQNTLDYAGDLLLGYAPDYPLQGEYVDKIGVSTGWTTGQVDAACVDVNFNWPGNYWQGPKSVRLWCQAHVERTSSDQSMGQNGDSGGPVFYYNYALHGRNGPSGIVWAKTNYDPITEGPGTGIYYSPVANINRELGPLTFY